MNKYNCIVFDFDGTLANTTAGVVATFQETFGRLGLEVPSAESLTRLIGLSLADIFRTYHPDMPSGKILEAADLYRSLFPVFGYPRVGSFDGILDLVRELHRRGFILAIATSRARASLEHLATELGLAPYFSAMFAVEDAAHPKPAPDLVQLALEQFSLSPSSVLVVGDTIFDIGMAHAAHCHACGVTWGNQSASELAGASPEYVVSAPAEILALV